MLFKSGGRPYGCRGYNNNHFASPSMRGFKSWSSHDVFVPWGPLCIIYAYLHPAHWAGTMATCPWISGALQTSVLEHSSLRAPGQSLASISAAVWFKRLLCRDELHDKPISSNLPENPLLPIKLLGSQFILLIEKDRRISKRLGRFPRFIITVLGHSYTDDCSPSCLWEVPIALGWVIDTLYHRSRVAKLCTAGDWSQRTTEPLCVHYELLSSITVQRKPNSKADSILLTPVWKQ